MKKFSLYLLVLLFVFLNNTFSDQTWDQPTGATKNYYFLVPAKLTVVSTNEPTDFYASYLNEELEWVKISPKYGWGVISNPFSFNWIPDYPIKNSSLGIHTSPRNENNFSIEPTDISDSLINVIFANAEFFNVPKTYTFYEDYTLYFNYTPNTLPYSVQLEVSYNEVEWFEFKNVMIDNSGQQKIEIFNDLVKTHPVKFRLTYNHIRGKAHDIAITDWINYSEVKFKVIDQLDLEYGVFNDITEFLLTYQKENLSNKRSFVLSYLVANRDTIFLDTIRPDEYTQTINPLEKINLNDYVGTIKILYYSAWGELLNTLTLQLDDKYLTLNQHLVTVNVNTPVNFNWSNSKHFSKIRIFEKEGDQPYKLISGDWDINKDYRVVKRTPGQFTYLFEVQDLYEVLHTESKQVEWVNEYVCKDDSLKTVIDSLYTLIGSIKQDTLVYTILVNESNSIIGETEESLNEIEFLLALDDYIKVDFNYNVRNVYLVDLKGSFLPIGLVGNGVEIELSQYVPGVYLLFVVSDDLKVKTYKFAK